MPWRKAFWVASSIFGSVFSHTAWAHDWLQFDTEGSKPNRQVFLIDLDSVGRGSSPRTIKFAILSEKESEWPAQVIADVVLDCGPRTGKVVRAELRGNDGALLEEVTEDPFGGTLTETNRGTAILGIACDNRWPASTRHFTGLTLQEVYRQTFGVPAGH